MPAPPISAELDVRNLLRRRVRAAKGSFLLGLVLFASSFLGFAFESLDSLPLTIPTAALAGFAVGAYFVATGFLWASLWALIVQLQTLLEELTHWIVGVLNTALAELRRQFVDGVIVDLAVIERQIEKIVCSQTERWASEENLWVPAVRQWAPPLAKEGLKRLTIRVADSAWQEEKLTVDALERQLSRLSPTGTRRAIRKMLWLATGIWLFCGALLLGIPFALAWVFSKLVAYV